MFGVATCGRGILNYPVRTANCQAETLRSISFEESVVGAAATDFELDALVTLRAATFIGRTILVDVNAHINAATIEFDADELALFGTFRRLLV